MASTQLRRGRCYSFVGTAGPPRSQDERFEYKRALNGYYVFERLNVAEPVYVRAESLRSGDLRAVPAGTLPNAR
jgi:hypothetical protein